MNHFNSDNVTQAVRRQLTSWIKVGTAAMHLITVFGQNFIKFKIHNLGSPVFYNSGTNLTLALCLY